MFTIDKHEKEILAVGYENKTIQTQDKWSQLNLMEIQSLLGTNQIGLKYILSHMSLIYIRNSFKATAIQKILIHLNSFKFQ